MDILAVVLMLETFNYFLAIIKGVLRENSCKTGVGLLWAGRKKKERYCLLESNHISNYHLGGNEVFRNEKVTSELSLTNAYFRFGTFSKKHFNNLFMMGIVLSLDWEKNMPFVRLPSRNIYSVKITLSQFSGNPNYFPFVGCKVSGGVCSNACKSQGEILH